MGRGSVIFALLCFCTVYLCACNEPELTLNKDQYIVELSEEANIPIEELIDCAKYTGAQLSQINVDLSNVNTKQIGIYDAKITFGEQEKHFSVEVKDTLPPTVDLKTKDIYCLVGSEIRFCDFIFKAIDNSKKIVISTDNGTVIPSVKQGNIEISDCSLSFQERGTYSKEMIVCDESNNSITIPITVHVISSPQINAENLYVAVDDVDRLDEYISEISVEDEVDGLVKDGIEVGVSNIDIHEPGQYAIYIEFENSKGISVSKRTICYVVTRPEIVVSDAFLAVGDEKELNSFIESIYVIDEIDGTVTDNILIHTDEVINDKAGEYPILIEYMNSKGISAAKSVILHLINRPVINAEDAVLVVKDEEALEKYWENITVTDEIDGTVTDNILIDKAKVNISKAGKYTIDIEYVNSMGVAATKTVSLRVINKPKINAQNTTITINDSVALNNYWNSITVIDDIDGTVTENIQISKEDVSIDKEGTYSVTIKYTNSKGISNSKKVKVTVELTYEQKVEQLKSKYVLNTVITDTVYVWGGEYAPVLYVYYWCPDTTYGLPWEDDVPSPTLMLREYIIAHPEYGIGGSGYYSVAMQPCEYLEGTKAAIVRVTAR